MEYKVSKLSSGSWYSVFKLPKELTPLLDDKVTTKR